MQQSKRCTKKYTNQSCASCGKSFDKDEMKVSYDFERFYCFRCDDKRWNSTMILTDGSRIVHCCSCFFFYLRLFLALFCHDCSKTDYPDGICYLRFYKDIGVNWLVGWCAKMETSEIYGSGILMKNEELLEAKPGTMTTKGLGVFVITNKRLLFLQNQGFFQKGIVSFLNARLALLPASRQLDLFLKF